MSDKSHKSYKIGALIFLFLILLGGFFFFTKNKKSAEIQPTNLELLEAGKTGEKVTHKLMAQIENSKGNPSDATGRYERGDIVLIFTADHQFSLAEKEGFLIIQMEMTPAQAEILTRAKEEESLGGEASKSLKRRKFTVDLSKLGIAPDDQKGREIEGKVFEWSIISEK